MPITTVLVAPACIFCATVRTSVCIEWSQEAFKKPPRGSHSFSLSLCIEFVQMFMPLKLGAINPGSIIITSSSLTSLNLCTNLNNISAGEPGVRQGHEGAPHAPHSFVVSLAQASKSISVLKNAPTAAFEANLRSVLVDFVMVKEMPREFCSTPFEGIIMPGQRTTLSCHKSLCLAGTLTLISVSLGIIFVVLNKSP